MSTLSQNTTSSSRLPYRLATVLVCAVFPLTGLAVALFAIVDFLLPKRVKQAGAA